MSVPSEGFSTLEELRASLETEYYGDSRLCPSCRALAAMQKRQREGIAQHYPQVEVGFGTLVDSEIGALLRSRLIAVLDKTSDETIGRFARLAANGDMVELAKEATKLLASHKN